MKDNVPPSVSKHFPLWHSLALQSAAAMGPAKRIPAIDAITDQMAAGGFVRPRADLSRADEWAARREQKVCE